MFYLTTHSTHFIYGYMASDIWLRTILIVREETRCRHIGYSYRLTARFFLYAQSHRQDNTYHGLCYTSRGSLAGMTQLGRKLAVSILWATLSDLQLWIFHMHHYTDRIVHTTVSVTLVVEYWLVQDVRTMSGRSTTESHLAPLIISNTFVISRLSAVHLTDVL